MNASVLHSDLLTDLPCGEARAEAPTPSVAEVYAAHARYVFRCLRSLGVAEGQLDDAVQDVFLVVNDKLAAFDGQAKLRTWLYAIVIRIARRYRAQRARGQHDCPEEARDERNAEAALLSREALALAQLALSTLGDDKREVFVLAEIEQMSAPEIATVTFTPLNTVYSRLRAARHEFERRLAALQKSGGIPSSRRAR